MITFVVNKLSSAPIFEQIISQTEQAILNGTLKPDEPMPSVRSAASCVGSNPNTIQRAYTQMLTMGWLYAVPGKGSFVSPNAINLIQNKYQNKLLEIQSTLIELKNAGVKREIVTSLIAEIVDKVYSE